MQHLRRFAGFAAIPALSMLSTLLLLPLISSRFGPDGWTSVAVGQSIGAILGVFAALAWPVVGSQMIAGSDASRRRVIFADSLKSRTAALVAVLPVGVGVCLALVDSHVATAVLFVVAVAMNGLTASWYFAGTGEPGKLLRNEAAVRLLGYGVSVAFIAAGADLWSYGAITLTAGVGMTLMNYGSVIGWQSSSVWSCSASVRSLVREQFVGGVSRVIASASMYSGSIIVAWIAPAALPLYSAIDQVQKSLVNATASFPQAMAWWVGSSSDQKARFRRVRTCYRLAAILGLVLFVSWSLVGVWVVGRLFSARVEVPILLNVTSAAAIAVIAVTQAVGLLVLVPLGLHRILYSATVVSSLIGVGGIIGGSYLFGAYGAIAGVLLSFVVLLAIYSVAYFRRVDVATGSHSGDRADVTAASRHSSKS